MCVCVCVVCVCVLSQVPHARNYVYESEVPVNVSRIVLAAGPMCVVQIHGGGAKGKHKEGPAGAKAAVKHHVVRGEPHHCMQITVCTCVRLLVK